MNASFTEYQIVEEVGEQEQEKGLRNKWRHKAAGWDWTGKFLEYLRLDLVGHTEFSKPLSVKNISGFIKK